MDGLTSEGRGLDRRLEGTEVGKLVLSCSLGTTCCVPQETFPQKPCNKSFIDQACSVLASF